MRTHRVFTEELKALARRPKKPRTEPAGLLEAELGAAFAAGLRVVAALRLKATMLTPKRKGTEMAHPQVVHCKHSRYDVYIGRPSKWGNPFQIGRDGTRARAIARYGRWISTQPGLLAALPELAGKTLGCWCAPHACHGEVLARLASEPGPGA